MLEHIVSYLALSNIFMILQLFGLILVWIICSSLTWIEVIIGIIRTCVELIILQYFAKIRIKEMRKVKEIKWIGF